MSEPFLGQILMAGFSYAPSGYHICDGTQMQVQQNAALYALLGTFYGGDGRTTFGLPDLRGRTFRGMTMGTPPVVDGRTVTSASHPGVVQGSNTVTLAAANLPIHNHVVSASTANATVSIAGNIPSCIVSSSGAQKLGYAPSSAQAVSMGNPVSTSGGEAHQNMQPYTTLNFIIAVSGVYPTRN